MANIEERILKDGCKTYRVKIRRKGYPVLSKTFSRKTDAHRFIRKIESEIDQGKHLAAPEATKRTLAEAVDRYIEMVLPRKPKSQIKQTMQLTWWKDQLGHLTLSQVTPSHIAEQRDILSRGKTPTGTIRSAGTTNRYLAALSHMLTIASKEWAWIDHNPVMKVERLKEPRGRVRYLDDDERERLLQACMNSKSPYLYTIVVLALATGGRKNEIVSLSRHDVDLNRQVVTFSHTKTDQIRSVPISGLAVELLAQCLKVHSLETDLLFPSHKIPTKPIEIRKPWIRALEEANIENFVFHDLRHTAASYLSMSGASTLELADVLGHRTLQMTKRYTHHNQSHLAKVMAKMQKRI